MSDRVNISVLREGLEELVDEEFQARVWTGQDPILMSSLEECLSSVFDDSGLTDALDRGQVFTTTLDLALRELDRETTKLVRLSRNQDAKFEECMCNARDLAGRILLLLKAAGD